MDSLNWTCPPPRCLAECMDALSSEHCCASNQCAPSASSAPPNKTPPRRPPCTSCESTLFPLDNLGGTLLAACHLRHRHDVVITSPASPPLCSSLLRLFRLMIFSAPFNNSEKLISTIHFAHLLSSWQELFMLPQNSPGWKQVQEGKKKQQSRSD